MISAHEADFYLKLCQMPELRALVWEFTGWKREHMLQRTMLRAFVPKERVNTGPL